MVFGRATDQTQSGCRLVPHGIRMKDRSQTGNQQYSLLAFCVFWMLSLGVSYESVTRPAAKKSNKVLGLELLERDLERGKPFFRRKRGKVRNLDGSGHKGLEDRLSSRLRRWIYIALGAPILFFFLPMTYIFAGSYKTIAMCTITQTWGSMSCGCCVL